MMHSFDIDVARKIGVKEAVILNNLYYWIEKNKANAKHFHDGYYWTYNSKKAFSELFPYLTERQIEYALDKLIKHGYIKTANYNEVKYDRTLWYAITKKGYSIIQKCESIPQFCGMEETNLCNPTTESVEPIPNINTDSKQDNKTTDINTNSISRLCVVVIDYLNLVTGSRFKPEVRKTRDLIAARFNEGFTEEDFMTVIDKKYKEWHGTDFEKYLRPSTLFGTKFEGYLNQVITTKPNSNGYNQSIDWDNV